MDTRVRAMYDWPGGGEFQLPLQKDQVYQLVQMAEQGWALGRDQYGNEGFFPASFIEAIPEAPVVQQTPPPAQVQVPQVAVVAQVQVPLVSQTSQVQIPQVPVVAQVQVPQVPLVSHSSQVHVPAVSQVAQSLQTSQSQPQISLQVPAVADIKSSTPSKKKRRDSGASSSSSSTSSSSSSSGSRKKKEDKEKKKKEATKPQSKSLAKINRFETQTSLLSSSFSSMHSSLFHFFCFSILFSRSLFGSSPSLFFFWRGC